MGVYAQMPEKILTIYDNGVEHEIGIAAYPYGVRDSSVTRDTPIITRNEKELTLSPTRNALRRDGSVFFESKVDLTPYTRLRVTVSDFNMPNTTVYALVTSQKADDFASAGSVHITGVGTWGIDISAHEGEYHVAIILGGTNSNTLTITKWWLE